MNVVFDDNRNVYLEHYLANALGSLMETESGGLTLKDLERTLHISQSAISRMAVRLTKAGYVEIRQDGADRRVKWVCLTERGRQ